MFAYINIKKILQTNCGALPKRGADMRVIDSIEQGYVLTDGKKIIELGSMQHFDYFKNYAHVDCSDRYVLPTYCDSHTHVVFAATRENEMLQRIQGATYHEIAAAGGGILNSALRLAETSEQQLYDEALVRIDKMKKQGTGAIEIKSGYGLTIDAELKMLRVIRKLKENCGLPIKATLLAAHAFPAEYKNHKSAYVDLIVNKILPQVADEGLADYCDAFVEKGFFEIDQARLIFEKAVALKLKIKVHANQLSYSGGVQLGCNYSAKSVDHLEYLEALDYETLSKSNTVATLLPAAAFFLNVEQANARQLIDNNAIVALASDFNPGTSPSGNMNFVNTLAVLKMKMTTYEAINASTINGAFAMDMEKKMGSLEIGKAASFIITDKLKSIDVLPYNFGDNSIHKVVLAS